MKSYRNKSVIIQAIQLTKETHQECFAFAGDSVTGENIGSCEPPYISIQTLGGEVIAVEGDYIVQTVLGDFYPCKAHVFIENERAMDSLREALLFLEECTNKRIARKVEGTSKA